MKRTKNMVYHPDDNSEKLQAFMDNNVTVQRQIDCIQEMLAKRVTKGTYDPTRAWEAFYHACNTAVTIYARKYVYRFPTYVRYTVACDLAEDFNIYIDYLTQKDGE